MTGGPGPATGIYVGKPRKRKTSRKGEATIGDATPRTTFVRGNDHPDRQWQGPLIAEPGRMPAQREEGNRAPIAAGG